MNGELYSASQIINKTLYAKTQVPLVRLAVDGSAVVSTVQPGQRVGTVYAWLDVKPGVRKNLYWMFYDQNNKSYYAEHQEGRFSTSDLADQGALTVKEQVKKEQDAKESTKTFIERMIKYAMITGGIVIVAKSFVPHLFKGRK